MWSVAKLPCAPQLSTACACVPGVRGTVVVSWADEKDTIGGPDGRATIGWDRANQRMGQFIDGASSCSHVREGSLVMAQDSQGFARTAACRGATARNEAAQVSAVCLSAVCLLRVEAPPWLPGSPGSSGPPSLPTCSALRCLPSAPHPLPPAQEFRVRVAPGSRAKSIMRILI